MQDRITKMAKMLGCREEDVERSLETALRSRDDAVASASWTLSILLGTATAAHVPEHIRSDMHALAEDRVRRSGGEG